METYSEVDEQSEETDNNWMYGLNDAGDGIILYGYSGETPADLIIPETLQYGDQTYNVTEIRGWAFDGQDITSVVIPSTVKSIGESAFRSCTQLKEVNLSKATSLETIESYAFQGISANTIIIPSSVKTIGEQAFSKWYEPQNWKLYLYGEKNSAAEIYCDTEEDQSVEFRNVNGIYLKQYIEHEPEIGDSTFQVSVDWPKNIDSSEIKWSSSNESVATVDQSGLVTKVRKGRVTITATKSDYSDSITIKFLKDSEVTEDGWRYRKISDKEVALCGYEGTTEQKTLVMPEKVEQYTVTKLDQFYVANWDGVKKIILPKTVEMVASAALVGFWGEVIVPEGTQLTYVGMSGLGYNNVYGPKDTSLQKLISNYKEDNQLYIYCSGSSQDCETGNTTYDITIEHIPSKIDDSVSWSISDDNYIIEKPKNETNIIHVRDTEKSPGGRITVTASVDEYSASLKLNFEARKYPMEGKEYNYTVLDKEKKTAALTYYAGSKDENGYIVIPETVDGYTITKICTGSIVTPDVSELVYVIPDTVTELEDKVFVYSISYDKYILVGEKGGSAEKYAKRHTSTTRFCKADGIALQTGETELKIDNSEDSDNYSMWSDCIQMKVLYAPDGINTDEIAWTSQDNQIASVDEQGLVTAKSQGETIIQAETGNKKATCKIKVGYMADGYCYKELDDGTVEITSSYSSQMEDEEIHIPEKIAGKDVSVIGSNIVDDSYYNVSIPNTVTTIRKNAISLSAWRTNASVYIPASVKNIEENAITGNGTGTVKVVGIKGSAAETYADHTKGVEFAEDQIVLECYQVYETKDGEAFGSLNVGDTTEIRITHVPKGIDKETAVVEWSSNSDKLTVKPESGNWSESRKASCKAVGTSKDDAVITCKIGDYSASLPFVIYDDTEFFEGDWRYTENADGTVNIISYEGNQTKLSIPSKINNKTVVSVTGFSQNDDIQEVTIPNTVTDIEYSAFYSCMNLTKVSFEDNSKLQSIGRDAFTGSRITSIVIPDSVTDIGIGAFANCKDLKKITLSNNIEGIKYSTFKDCTSLTQITIPEGVTHIDSYAFIYSGLTSVQLPDSLVNIEQFAFANCELTSVKLPDSVVSIENSAFEDNEKLSDIVIGNKTAYIGESAFRNCGAKELSIGGTDAEIGMDAYADSRNLKKLTLREGVTTLGYRSFSNCENLETIEFPKSLVKINGNAFYGTKWLADKPEGMVYAGYNDKILLQYKGKAEKAVIKEGTEYIEGYAFDGQDQMTEVVIPSTVKTIRSQAFINCDRLTRIVIPDTVETIESEAIGYYGSTYSAEKDLNTVIVGLRGSAAEKYANDNGFTFEPLAGITLDRSGAVLKKGEEITLKATYTPEDADVSWSSDNEKVVTVKNGKVTAVEAGTATITAKVGDYAAKCKIKVVIPLSEDNVKMPDDSAVYTGKEIHKNVTVIDGNKTLTEGTDYEVTYKNNINAGMASLTVTGKGDYTGSVTENFYILRSSIFDQMVTLKKTKMIYTGEELKPEVVVKVGDATLKEGQDYTLTYKDNVEVGTATVTVKGINNYCEEVQKTFEISAITITDEMVSLDKVDYSYNGKEILPKVTVTDGNTVLTEGTDYEVSYKDNVNVGTASVTVTGKSHYTGSVTKKYNIAKNLISDDMLTLKNTQMLYTGKALTPEVAVKGGDNTLKEGQDYTVIYKNNVNVGTATVTVEGINNYTGKVEKTFEIQAAMLGAGMVSLDKERYTYIGKEILPKVTVTDVDKLLVEGKDYEVEYINNIDAGRAFATVIGKGNYTGSIIKEYTILKKEISDDMVTLKSTKMVYTGEELRPEVVVKDGETTLQEGQDYTLTYKDNVEVGTATVTVTGINNYCEEIQKTFNIVDAIPITDEMVSLDKNEYTYTGKGITPKVTVKVGETVLKQDTDYVVTYTDNVKTGTARVTVEGTGEYAGKVEKTFTIMPKVSYRTQVQTYGWEKNYTSNGGVSGTMGQGKRLETIQVKVEGSDDLGIEYRTHVQSYGWMDWSFNGANSGTVGQGKRLEAIQIRLTGKDASKYEVYYRVHAQSYGWLNWAKDGAYAGTAGLSKRLEAIQIVIVKAGTGEPEKVNGISSASKLAYVHTVHVWNAGEVTKEPTCTAKGQKLLTCKECGETKKADIPAAGHKWDEGKITKPAELYTENGIKTYTCTKCGATKTEEVIKSFPVDVSYRTQVQTYGWQKTVKNGQLAGTMAQGKRMETMTISVKDLAGADSDLGICYNAHVQSIGWQGDPNNSDTWKKDGENAGTVGMSKRLEAIQIELTGDDAEKYDVYYRVHAQSYGWLNWAKNGEISGTAGCSKRLEAIQIMVVERDAKINTCFGGIKSTNNKSYIVK